FSSTLTPARSTVIPYTTLFRSAVATYAVPANVLAAPAVPPATVLGVLATVVSPWLPALAGPLATAAGWCTGWIARVALGWAALRSEEHTSELQSRENLVCRLLL